MSWYWKSDLRLKDEDESGWTLYDDEATKKLEKAYQKGQKTMKLSEKHKIDFKDMIQHRIEDRDRQRPIKRLDNNAPANNKKRKEPTPKAAAPKGKAAGASADAAAKRDLSLRPGGKAKAFYLADNVKQLVMAKVAKKKTVKKTKKNDDDGYGDSDQDEFDNEEVMFSDYDYLPVADLEAQMGSKDQFRYGDLLYFDDYRGVGLFVVGKDKNQLVLRKTKGEMGYVIPRDVRDEIPRKYWGNDDTVEMGWEILDEGYGSDD